jgi:AcrR family transcriptional regulator
MPRRQAWNGNPPGTEANARRRLLTVAQECIERHGLAKVGLSDVATAAGVTRQTVYRHFASADDLFNAAAVSASGGFLEQMRSRALRCDGLAARIVETMVIVIREIPKDVHLSSLVQSVDPFAVSSALERSFIQDEIITLSADDQQLSARNRDELAELLVRLLKSFVDDPGPTRTEAELRRFLSDWLVPIVERKIDA